MILNQVGQRWGNIKEQEVAEERDVNAPLAVAVEPHYQPGELRAGYYPYRPALNYSTAAPVTFSTNMGTAMTYPTAADLYSAGKYPDIEYRVPVMKEIRSGYASAVCNQERMRMLSLKELTDVELAVLTYAVEQEHDSARHEEEEYKNGYIETAERLREELDAEYESRNLNCDTWQVGE